MVRLCHLPLSPPQSSRGAAGTGNRAGEARDREMGQQHWEVLIEWDCKSPELAQDSPAQVRKGEAGQELSGGSSSLQERRRVWRKSLWTGGGKASLGNYSTVYGRKASLGHYSTVCVLCWVLRASEGQSWV